MIRRPKYNFPCKNLAFVGVFVLLTEVSGGTTSCSPSNFICESDGSCISSDWVCDGDRDCMEGEDENDCRDRPCKSNTIKCESSGRCISRGMPWLCNSVTDSLIDLSEENGRNISVLICPEDFFKCHSSSKCIRADWICDGDQDCDDGSDEKQNCTETKSCSHSQFKCNDGRCIDWRFVCDNSTQCTHGEDESRCSELRKLINISHEDNNFDLTTTTESSPVPSTFNEESNTSTTVIIVVELIIIIILLGIIIVFALKMRSARRKVLVRPYVASRNNYAEPSDIIVVDGMNPQVLEIEQISRNEGFLDREDAFENADAIVNQPT